jgi:hypothetical protein
LRTKGLIAYLTVEPLFVLQILELDHGLLRDPVVVVALVVVVVLEGTQLTTLGVLLIAT